MEAIAFRLEAIALGLEAIALRLEAIAFRLEVITFRLKDMNVSALSLRAISDLCDFAAKRHQRGATSYRALDWLTLANGKGVGIENLKILEPCTK